MRLVLVPSALAELNDAAAFYTMSSNVELGRAFLDEFERSIDAIVRNPKLAPFLRGKRRRYLMRRFPYGIIYQEANDELRVIAVAHQNRRPAYWARRS